MSGNQKAFKEKIRSTEALKKIFRAMELIASSRIAKARRQALSLDPYSRAITRSLAAVANHARRAHPMLEGRDDTNRVAILVVTADRGMAGAYSATILRETERLMEQLRANGKEPVLYVCGRRGESYFKFRHVPVAASWTGFSDRPSWAQAQQISETLLEAFSHADPAKAVGELCLIYTTFVNSMTQTARVHRMLPLEVVDAEDTGKAPGVGASTDNTESVEGAIPLYEFEPNADEVLSALLPLYVRKRIYALLLMSAASELASRQRAMHTATDNAEDLIRKYTRLYNNARQSAITTELTELISGADALANQS